MKRRHVCVVCPGLGDTGSVATVARMHALELARYFRVTLVSNSRPADGLQDFAFRAVESRQFNYLRRFCHAPNEFAYVKATSRQLSALHAADPIDAVICHGHALAWFAGVPLQRAKGVPVLLVVHADIFDRPRGTYDVALTRFYRYATVRAYRTIDPIVIVSPGMADAATRAGAPPGAIKVIPNGIDPNEIGLDDDEANREESDAREDTLCLLYVGRLAIEKGVDVLLKACRLLKHAAIPHRLRIAGSGPLESACRSHAASLGLSDQVEFVGAIERRKLGALYRWSDIVCVPSLSEPFGLVALEALTCGRSVVASRVGGLPFIVEDGKTGALVSPGSPEELANAIKALGADRDALRAMGRRARVTARSRFGWRKIGEDLRGVLDAAMRNAIRS